MSDIEEIARAEMARVEDVIDTMADETCAQIKADSPAGGKYRSGWAIRKENKYGTRYRAVSYTHLSAVNACIEILSNSMAKRPVFIMDSQTKKHLAHPLLKLLTERPNEAMVPSVFMKLIESNRLVSGNGYALIVRDRSNARPRELIPLTPSAVQP